MTDLCSISDVEALTQQTYSGSTKPTSTQVGQWIDDISSFLEEWTGIVFAETTVTNEKHSGNGTPYILLKNYPLISITSLVVDNVTLVSGTDYWIADLKAGFIECKTPPLERLDGLAEGHENIVVTYKWGKTSIPASVKELAATIIALKCISAATMSASSSGAVKAYSDGDVSISYAEGDSVATRLLSRYQELKLQVPKRIKMEVGSP